MKNESQNNETVPRSGRGDVQQLYQRRLERFVTAMRNEKPDMIPIRPLVAEFTSAYCGWTCQDITHDYKKAFDAALRCAKEFDWDAMVPNMVYVWTGMTQAIGLKYYGIPGIDVEPDFGFQYREPPEEDAFMKPDEYDALIDDPTGFLYEVWLPRVSTEVCRPGGGSSYRNNVALVKGGMAMMQYFSDLGRQVGVMKEQAGTVPALAGILKSPFDIIADKLRGYIGLTMDMMERPEKVLAAAEAIMPHVCNVALQTADPSGNVPVGFWMHRGCVPFVTPDQFESHYWPTLRPVIEELWKNGHQTLFYAEGDWGAHLERFAELPERSIVYHVDKGDIFKTHEVLGDKFCISGGIHNSILSFGTPDEVRRACKEVIDGVAADGGYIMDAGAIMQNDVKPENLRALTDFTREYGVYTGDNDMSDEPPAPTDEDKNLPGINFTTGQKNSPNVCIPWKQKLAELPGGVQGDEELARTVWEQVDSLGSTFIW